MKPVPHQYVDRDTGRVLDEAIAGEGIARLVYSDFPLGRQGLSRLFSGEWATRAAAFAYFDAMCTPGLVRSFARAMRVREDELAEPVTALRTRRDVFLRRIRFEEVRPMTPAPEAVVSPADGKLIWGDLTADAAIRVKERFFDLETLVGSADLARRFAGGTYGVFRLAPPDYHYFHAPVAGIVASCRELEGRFYSVNPLALSSVEQVLSSNRRVVVVIDTDGEGGTCVGQVAVIPVAAQVIGRIEMAYSDSGYDSPAPVREGLAVRKGQPMGAFHPGSSTVVLLFEPGRATWCPDLAQHRDRSDTKTRYAERIFGRNLTETFLRVRDAVAYRANTMPADRIALGGGRVLMRDAGGWVVRGLDKIGSDAP